MSETGKSSKVENFNHIFLLDGKDNASWAINLKSENFELLCPSGGRASVDKYETCNLLQSPPHMVRSYSVISHVLMI